MVTWKSRKCDGIERKFSFAAISSMKWLVFACVAIPFLLPAQSKLIQEDFSSNKRNWPTDKFMALQDGRYLLTTSEEGAEAFVSFYVDPVRDFSLGIDIEVKQSEADAAIGLAWGVGSSDYNIFMISPEGEYIVASGDLSKLKGWKKSPAIRPVPALNQLRVESKGGTYSFLINGQVVDQRSGMQLFGSYSGILVFSSLEALVDDFYFDQVQQVRVAEDSEKFSRKENLGAGVNSEGDELGPIISTDGLTLYFARQHVADNVGGVNDSEDVWTSHWENGMWRTARNMGKAVNTPLSDNLVAISSDNNTMIFQTPEGMTARHRSMESWSAPEKIKLPFVNESDHFVACLSADGKAMIVSARLKANVAYNPRVEENDLYVIYKNAQNEWAAPVNLGKMVNTAGEETSPFLAADGKTLYFATNGRPGFGDQDIFVTKRNGLGWTNWTEPQNLGPAVNSPSFDAYYTVPASGEHAYFVTYDESRGGADLFRMALHAEARPDAVVLVKGKVLNKDTNQPIGAAIIFEDLSTGQEIGEARSDPKTGQYQIILPFGKNYGFKALVNGYYAMHDNLELQTLGKYQEIDRDLYLIPIIVGRTIKLNNVFFEAGTPVLKPESYPELDHLVELLNDNPGITIDLAGHTDNKGDVNTLLKLSEDRVATVRSYLIGKGINAQRISGKGYGAQFPVASSDTEENSRLNRRVEFKITKM